MGLIGQVAEAAPDQIRALVYVASMVPPNGSCLMQLVASFDPEYLAQIAWAPDRRTVLIQPEGARNFLYPRCPPAQVESSLARLTPEPVAPFETPFSATEANFGRVPRYYIECLQDRVIPIALQRAMRGALPFRGVYTLNTDHSPFFSAPDELAGALNAIAMEA
jgi:pimeloyl-ACP methyl ester carboxylesterase